MGTAILARPWVRTPDAWEASSWFGPFEMRPPLDRMIIRRFQAGRRDPISNTYGPGVRRHGHRPHQGWDLEAKPGTLVYAISDGELTVGFGHHDYGNWASLEFGHRRSKYFAFYAHLQMHVVRNASVREGAVIALTGKTGNARGLADSEAHLHFEIRTVEHPHHGLVGRIDPGEILGYGVYSSHL